MSLEVDTETDSAPTVVLKIRPIVRMRVRLNQKILLLYIMNLNLNSIFPLLISLLRQKDEF